jgi:hypothetical protein
MPDLKRLLVQFHADVADERRNEAIEKNIRILKEDGNSLEEDFRIIRKYLTQLKADSEIFRLPVEWSVPFLDALQLGIPAAHANFQCHPSVDGAR